MYRSLRSEIRREGGRRTQKLFAVLATVHVIAWSLACEFSRGDGEGEEEAIDAREILASGALDYPIPARGFSTELTWPELRTAAPGLFESGDRTYLGGLTFEPSRYPPGVVPDSRPNELHVRGLDASFIALATERYGEPRAYTEGEYEFWSWVNPDNHLMLHASADRGSDPRQLEVTFRPYVDIETCVGSRDEPLGFMGEAWIGVRIDDLRQRFVGRMTQRDAGAARGSETLYAPPCYPWWGNQEWALTFGYGEPGVVEGVSTTFHYRGQEEHDRLIALLRARFDEQTNISSVQSTVLFIPGRDDFEVTYSDETVTNGYVVSIRPRRPRPSDSR